MSATTPTRKAGRPATGITKDKPGLSIDRKILAAARKAAFKQQMSLSAYVERAIANHLTGAAQ